MKKLSGSSEHVEDKIKSGELLCKLARSYIPHHEMWNAATPETEASNPLVCGIY